MLTAIASNSENFTLAEYKPLKNPATFVALPLKNLSGIILSNVLGISSKVTVVSISHPLLNATVLSFNIMTIDSNEIKQPMRNEFKPVKETYSDYIKPCELIDDHMKNCAICRSKFQNTIPKIEESASFSKNYLENIENFNNFDLNENFENISPSQKNLLVIILYGILIILISDLIIKERND